MSFANIDKKVFYKAILTSRIQRHDFYIIVDVHIKEVSEKRDVKKNPGWRLSSLCMNVSEQPSTKVKCERRKDQGRFYDGSSG